VKSLVSGEQSKILKFFAGKKIEYRTTTLNFFTPSETKEYFKEFEPSEENLIEIYKISNKGQPSRLSTIKRNCKEKGLDFYLNNDLSEKSDLFELEWKDITFDELLENIIGVIVFGDSKFNLSMLSSILDNSENEVATRLQKLSFIETINDQYAFISENYRSFAAKKFGKAKERILGLLIIFYTNNLSEDKNHLNLPTLYLKAKRYTELINHLSLDVPSIFDGRPSESAIQLIEQSDIHCISYQDFDQCCARHHDLERAARKLFSVIILMVMEDLESLRFCTANERYQIVQKRHPGILKRCPLKYIASYIGTSQVSLSRIRAGVQ